VCVCVLPLKKCSMPTHPKIITQFVQPITKSQKKGATPRAVELGKKKEAALKEMHKAVIIARFKKDHKELLKMKEKFENVIFCQLSDLQREMYKEVLSKYDFLLLSQARKPCDCGVNNFFFEQIDSFGDNKKRIKVREPGLT